MTGSINPPCMLIQTFEEYCDSPGINHSSLKLLQAVGPRKFKHIKDNPERKHTKAMDLGSCTHHLLLKPEEREDYVAIRPDCYADYRTIKSQEWRDSMRAFGRVPITTQDWDLIQAMIESVRKDETAGVYFQSSRMEMSAFAVCQETGLLKKGRLDILPNRDLFAKDSPIPLVDLKTTSEATEYGFTRQAKKEGYANQLAFYLDLAEACGDKRDAAILVAVCSEPPHEVMTLQVDELSIQRSQHENLELLKMYTEFQKNGWRNPPGVRIISI